MIELATGVFIAIVYAVSFFAVWAGVEVTYIVVSRLQGRRGKYDR